MEFYDMLKTLKNKTSLSNPGSVMIEIQYNIPFDCYFIFVSNYITIRRKSVRIDACHLESLSNDIVRNRFIEDVLVNLIQCVMEERE